MKNSPRSTPKTSNYKRKKEKEKEREKTVKELRGYWTQFALKQKERDKLCSEKSKKSTCLSATSTVSQQPVVKSTGRDVMGNSPSYNPVQQPAASEDNYSSTMKGKVNSKVITTTVQLGQGESL